MANFSRSRCPTVADAMFSRMFEGTVPLKDSDINEDEAFTLAIGEACKVKQEYVDSLSEDKAFKMLWTRVDNRSYRWLASDGSVGTEFGDGDVGLIKFSCAHWEKTKASPKSL